MDEKLDMSQQHALTAQKANCLEGCIKNSVGSRSREVLLPLCSEVLYPALGSSGKEMHGPLGVGTEKVVKVIKGLAHLSCEEGRVGFLQPGEGSRESLLWPCST